MSVFSKLRGTIETIFQLNAAAGGPQLKAVGAAIQPRNSADSAGAALSTIKTATFDGENSFGNSGATPTVDWTVAQKQTITLNANAVTFAFTAPLGVGNFLLRLVQDATGTRVPSWPATVKWVGSVTPTFSTAANAIDIVSFYYNGTNYFGTYRGNWTTATPVRPRPSIGPQRKSSSSR